MARIRSIPYATSHTLIRLDVAMCLLCRALFVSPKSPFPRPVQCSKRNLDAGHAEALGTTVEPLRYSASRKYSSFLDFIVQKSDVGTLGRVTLPATPVHPRRRASPDESHPNVTHHSLRQRHGARDALSRLNQFRTWWSQVDPLIYKEQAQLVHSLSPRSQFGPSQ